MPRTGILHGGFGHTTTALLLFLAVIVFNGGSSTSSSSFAVATTPIETLITSSTHATTTGQDHHTENEEEHDQYNEQERQLGRDEQEQEYDAPELFPDSMNNPGVLVEGCLLPATTTSVNVKHGKPSTGNIAENAIDNDASTM